MEEKEVFNGFDDDMDYIDPDDFEEDEEVEDTKEETDTDGKEDEESLEETETQESETDEDDEEKAKTQEESESETEAEKLHKRNEEQKAKRLKREAEERERIQKQAKLEGKLEVLKTNPYTNEKIEDEEDLKIYEIQKQLDDEGYDPIEDLPRKMAEINRQAKKEELAKAKETEERESNIQKDLNEFFESNPKVDRVALSKNDEFWDFANDLLGTTPFSKIYSTYQKILKRDSAKEKEAMIDKKASDMSKKYTKTPSASGSNKQANKGFLEMSDEEYLQYQKDENGDFF